MSSTLRQSIRMTYSVGDWVFSRDRNSRHRLARIESANPSPGDLWKVRERFVDYWGPAAWRPVTRSLTPREIAHNRTLGLIPQRGGSL